MLHIFAAGFVGTIGVMVALACWGWMISWQQPRQARREAARSQPRPPSRSNPWPSEPYIKTPLRRVALAWLCWLAAAVALISVAGALGH